MISLKIWLGQICHDLIMNWPLKDPKMFHYQAALEFLWRIALALKQYWQWCDNQEISIWHQTDIQVIPKRPKKWGGGGGNKKLCTGAVPFPNEVYCRQADMETLDGLIWSLHVCADVAMWQVARQWGHLMSETQWILHSGFYNWAQGHSLQQQGDQGPASFRLDTSWKWFNWLVKGLFHLWCPPYHEDPRLAKLNILTFRNNDLETKGNIHKL